MLLRDLSLPPSEGVIRNLKDNSGGILLRKPAWKA